MKKEISFKNNKGQTLRGDLYVPDKKYKLKYPSIIVCHGFTGDKEEHLALSDALLNAGFIVLRFDFGGHSQSEGKFEETSLSQQVSELQSAINSLFSLDKVDKTKIGVVGQSFGGTVGIVAATKDSRIKSLVTIGTVHDLIKPVRPWWGTNRLHKLITKKEKIDIPDTKYQIDYSFVEDLKKYNVLNSASKIKIPFLLIHSLDDGLVGVSQSKTIAKQNRRAVLKLIKGESHEYGEESIKLTVNWFKKTLRQRRNKVSAGLKLKI